MESFLSNHTLFYDAPGSRDPESLLGNDTISAVGDSVNWSRSGIGESVWSLVGTYIMGTVYTFPEGEEYE